MKLSVNVEIKGEPKPGNKIYNVIRLSHEEPSCSSPELWAAKSMASLKKLMREEYVGEQDGIQFGSTKAERKEFEQEFNENEWADGDGSGTIIWEEIGTINK